MADTGTYACIAKNSEGDGTTVAELVIVESLSEDDDTYNYIRPSFPKGLRRMRVREGRVARIEIRVSGHPPPEVTWLKDGVEIEGDDRVSVERAPGGVETLVISGVAPTDSGRYQVMASSAAGKASVAADLVVVDLEADVDTDDEGDGKRQKRRKHRRIPTRKKQEAEVGEKPALSKEILAWRLAKKQRDYSPSTTSEAISLSDLQHHYRTRKSGEQYVDSDHWTSNIAVSPVKTVGRRRGPSPMRDGGLSPLILGRRASTPSISYTPVSPHARPRSASLIPLEEPRLSPTKVPPSPGYRTPTPQLIVYRAGTKGYYVPQRAPSPKMGERRSRTPTRGGVLYTQTREYGGRYQRTRRPTGNRDFMFTRPPRTVADSKASKAANLPPSSAEGVRIPSRSSVEHERSSSRGSVERMQRLTPTDRERPYTPTSPSHRRTLTRRESPHTPSRQRRTPTDRPFTPTSPSYQQRLMPTDRERPFTPTSPSRVSSREFMEVGFARSISRDSKDSRDSADRSRTPTRHSRIELDTHSKTVSFKRDARSPLPHGDISPRSPRSSRMDAFSPLPPEYQYRPRSTSRGKKQPSPLPPEVKGKKVKKSKVPKEFERRYTRSSSTESDREFMRHGYSNFRAQKDKEGKSPLPTSGVLPPRSHSPALSDSERIRQSPASHRRMEERDQTHARYLREAQSDRARVSSSSYTTHRVPPESPGSRSSRRRESPSSRESQRIRDTSADRSKGTARTHVSPSVRGRESPSYKTMESTRTRESVRMRESPRFRSSESPSYRSRDALTSRTRETTGTRSRESPSFRTSEPRAQESYSSYRGRESPGYRGAESPSYGSYASFKESLSRTSPSSFKDVTSHRRLSAPPRYRTTREPPAASYDSQRYGSSYEPSGYRRTEDRDPYKYSKHSRRYTSKGGYDSDRQRRDTKRDYDDRHRRRHHDDERSYEVSFADSIREELGEIEELPRDVVTRKLGKREPEVEGPPVFLKLLRDVKVMEGRRILLEVEVTGSRPMDVAWLKNGKDIPDCEDFRYINRGNICQLEIAEIFPEDSGKYTCEVLNDLGDADCHCNVSVSEEPSVSISVTGTQEVSYTTSQQAMMDEDHIPPEFFEEPESAVLEEGQTARFVCDVDGEPIPKVTWLRGGQAITDGGRYFLKTEKFSNTLEISNVTPSDAGSYTCRAVNSEGEVTSNFTLTVMPGRSGPSSSSDTLGFRPIPDDDDSLIDEMM